MMYNEQQVYRISYFATPSIAQGTHSYSQRLPSFSQFYWETIFSLLKLTPST